MTQVDLARRIGISASYLNLIEHNRRTLPAELLIRLTEVLPVDLKTLSPDHDGRVLGELLEAFGDPLFDELDVLAGDVREFAMNFPTAGQAVLRLYEAYRAKRESAQSLGEELLSDGEGVAPVAGTRLPTEEVSDFLQRHLNYFPELEEGAETLTRDARLESDVLFENLAAYLERELGIDVRVEQADRMQSALRRYDPNKRVLYLSELLRRGSRNFQLAHTGRNAHAGRRPATNLERPTDHDRRIPGALPSRSRQLLRVLRTDAVHIASRSGAERAV